MKIPFQNHLATCQEVIYSWLAIQLCWTTSTKAIPQLSVAFEKICGVHAERGGKRKKRKKEIDSRRGQSDGGRDRQR